MRLRRALLRDVRLERRLVRAMFWDPHEGRLVFFEADRERPRSWIVRSPELLRQIAATPDLPFLGPRTAIWDDDARLAKGQTLPLKAYIEDTTPYAASSVNEIERFLRNATFTPDVPSDHWLRPREFEEHPVGDCEDHAWWAWSKLRDLGLYAEIVFGSWSNRGLPPENHAWVRFVEDGVLFNMETTAKTITMIAPWHDVVDAYQPDVGVDSGGMLWQYSPIPGG